MMRYVMAVILLILTIVNAKIAYDVYYKERQNIRQLNVRIEQQHLKLLALHDQVVALRQQSQLLNRHAPHEHTTTDTSQRQKSKMPKSPDNYLAYPTNAHRQEKNHWVLDHLVFIESLLKEQKLSMALLYIIRLKQELTQSQPLPDSLNQTLLQALQQDQNNFATYQRSYQEQQKSIQQQLILLEQHFQQNTSLEQPQQQWQWQNWLSFQKAEQIPNLTQRHIDLKYVQLLLLLAEQALLSGQTVFYQQQLQAIEQRLAYYPDSFSQNLRQSIQQLQRQTLPDLPHFTALHLMQNQHQTAQKAENTIIYPDTTNIQVQENTAP